MKELLLIILIGIEGMILPSWKHNQARVSYCQQAQGQRCTKRIKIGSEQYLDYVTGLIEKESVRTKIDPLVLLTIIKQESAFNPNLKNAKSGASGLCQLMPYGIATIYYDTLRNGIEYRAGGAKLLIPEFNLQLCANNLAYCQNACSNEPAQVAGCHQLGYCPTNKITNYMVQFQKTFNKIKAFISNLTADNNISHLTINY